MSGDDFEMWVVYDHPSDFPKSYVARRWVHGRQHHGLGHSESVATGEIILSTDIDDVRQYLASMGLTRMHRADGDDPVIMETWL